MRYGIDEEEEAPRIVAPLGMRTSRYLKGKYIISRESAKCSSIPHLVTVVDGLRRAEAKKGSG